MGVFSRPSVATGVYICYSDILALLVDVYSIHLDYSSSGNSSSSATSTYKQQLPYIESTNNSTTTESALINTILPLANLNTDYLYSTTILPCRERFWTTVSGSADLLTIQCSSIIDHNTMIADIYLRVYNSSGFKIPIFSLELLMNTHSYTNINTTTNTTTSSSNNNIMKQKGVEFFLPESYIERKFQYKIQKFTSFQAIVRLIYRDLVYDEDNIYEIPLNNNIHNIEHKNKLNKALIYQNHIIKQRYLSEYQDINSNKWAAILDCQPYFIPTTALLLPYSYGILSSLIYFTHIYKYIYNTFIPELTQPGDNCNLLFVQL